MKKTILLSFCFVIVVLLSYEASAALSSTNMVIRLRMDSNVSNSTQTNYTQGNTVTNASITGGPTFNDSDGGFYKLDGVNDFINVNIIGNWSSDVTFSIWAKASTGFTDGMDIFAKRFDDRIFLSSSGVPKFNQKNGTGSDVTSTVSNWGVLSSNYWTHLCMQYDDTNNRQLSYINGVLWSNVSQDGRSNNSNTYQIGVGQAGTYFNGSVDDLVIYNGTGGSSCTQIYANGRSDLPYVNTTINFNSPSTIINKSFIGWNRHQWQGINGSFLDVTGDGTLDTLANATYIYDLRRNATNALNDRTDWELDQLVTNITDNGAGFINITVRNSSNSNARNISHHIQFAQECIAFNRTCIVTVQYMPSVIANTTYCTGDTKTCTASNYSMWNYTIQYMINITGMNNNIGNFYFELWNEPDSASFWMADLDPTNNASLREQLFNYHYNETYKIIRGLYPTAKIGGPAITSLTTTAGSRMFSSWAGNFSKTSSPADFCSHHDYINTINPGGSYDSLYSTYGNMESLLTAVGASCPVRFLSEVGQNKDIVADFATRDELEANSIIASALDYQLNKNLSAYWVTWYELTCIANFSTSGCDDNHPHIAPPQVSNPAVVRGAYVGTVRGSNALAYQGRWVNISQTSQMSRVTHSYNTSHAYVTISNLNNVSETHILQFGNWSSARQLRNMINGTNYSITSSYSEGITATGNQVVYLQLLNDTIPYITSESVASYSPYTGQFNFSFNQALNLSINYGTTTSLGTVHNVTSFSTSTTFNISNLRVNTTYFYQTTVCNVYGTCITNSTRNFTTQYDYTLQDKSGNNLNASFVNATNPPTYNSALEAYDFDGTQRGILLLNQSQTPLLKFNSSTSFSLYIDFKLNTGSCTNSNSSGLFGRYFRYGMHITGSQCTIFYGLRNASNSTEVTTSGVSVGYGVKTTALMTYNNVTGNTSLYVNGTLRASRIIANMSGLEDNASVQYTSLRIFDENGILSGTSYRTNGTTYDAKVYNTTINSTQAMALHAGLTTGCSNLVAWYDFKNTTSTGCTEQYTTVFVTIDTVDPVGVATTTLDSSTTLSYTLNNYANQTTTSTWYVDGNSSIASSCNNSTSCVLSGSTLGEGVYTVLVNITAPTNSVSYSWTLTVQNAAQADVSSICTNSSGSLLELSGWLATIALVIGAVVVIGAIKLYSSGMLPDIGSALGVGDLGTVAILLVGSAITISIAVQIVVSAIC